MPNTTTSRTFTHTLFPEDWQLAKAQAGEGLMAIVLPFDDGEWLPDDLSDCKVEPDGSVKCDRPGWSNGWGFGLEWHVGDRICFAEPWVYSNTRKKAQARSCFRLDLDEFVQWESPAFMPDEAAHFWFEVTAIQVEKLGKIPFDIFYDSGLYYFGEPSAIAKWDESYMDKAISRWNDAHASHPHKPELWAIVLVVKAVDFLEED